MTDKPITIQQVPPPHPAWDQHLQAATVLEVETAVVKDCLTSEPERVLWGGGSLQVFESDPGDEQE